MNFIEKIEQAKAFSRKLNMVDDVRISKILYRLAEILEENSNGICKENQKDLAKMDPNDPLYDRVLLDENRTREIAESVREIAGYPSPIGRILEEKVLNNGLSLQKVSTPLGVVGAIFEARPNVLVDTFSLCFKSKNVAIMKGGSQSENTNRFLKQLISEVLFDEDLSDAAVLLPNDREFIAHFLKMDRSVDVIIPRGSQELIDFVRHNSSIPVIETGRGVCHLFFDEDGDLEMGRNIIFNAKTQRPSVCNALDTLIVCEKRVADLPQLCADLAGSNVKIYSDKLSFEALRDHYPSELISCSEIYGEEFMSLKMSIKVVSNIDEAIKHINFYGSGHSETIITGNKDHAERFLLEVDAAVVYHNASTRFTDGGEFGLGAEVGISTQKLHARGPMGIKELCSYKWQARGDGQVRR